MKIALMTNNYKPFIGGVPVSIERLKEELLRQGHQVTVFAPSCGEGASEEDHVFRYGSFSKKVMGGVTLPNPFDFGIEKEFAKGNFDVIHVHHPMLIGKTALYLSRKYGVPLAFTYHTRYEQYVTAYTGTKLFEPFVSVWLRGFLKRCDIILTPTKGLKDYLRDACGIAKDRLFVLPTGLEEKSYRVDGQKAADIRRRFGAENIPLFLTVARLAPEKNLEFLLYSMARVKGLSKKPFRWIIVGDGPKREEYEALAGSLGIEEIVFAGKVDNEEMPAYYGAADSFLFASKTETQGIVILEAFAGKTPVYAVQATGVEDLVEHGRNGYLTREDTEEYAGRILDFLEGRTDKESLAENAYKTALSFREEAVAIQALRLYNRIIAEKQECKIPKIEGHHSWKTTSIKF